MTVNELKNALSLETLVEGDQAKDVSTGYCGDLLSWVMSRADAGCAWITVMGNINAVAVCALAEISCMILADNAALDDAARARAEMEHLPILRSNKNIYELAVALSRLLPS